MFACVPTSAVEAFMGFASGFALPPPLEEGLLLRCVEEERSVVCGCVGVSLAVLGLLTTFLGLRGVLSSWLLVRRRNLLRAVTICLE
mmetsp:Transcript_31229/g.65448  ORF Transcript_31229/g.65448 Transcript_31229/m.65448 type:complete len:87 (+) Transcript_31229:118-378(+)